MIERQDIKTAIDILDQYPVEDVGHVVSILMQCSNYIAALVSENTRLKEEIRKLDYLLESK